MRLRFSIARLLWATAYCGVAFAALRSPSYLWANLLFTAAAAALVVATIHVAFSRGPTRVFWAGFLIAGGSYFTVDAVPALRESICPRLLTETVLDLIYPSIVPSPPPPTPAPAGPQGAMMSMMGMMGGAPPAAPPASNPPSPWVAWSVPDRLTGVGYPIGPIALTNSTPFRQIGHSLSILLFAVLGGLYARHLAERNRVCEPT